MLFHPPDRRSTNRNNPNSVILFISIVVFSSFLTIFLYLISNIEQWQPPSGSGMLADDNPANYWRCADLPFSFKRKRIIRIGVLLVATGQFYADYTRQLVFSGRQFFFSAAKQIGRRCSVKVTYYVITSHPFWAPSGDDVYIVKQDRMGWPSDTLLRCQMYLNASSLLNQKADYLIAMDADLSFVGHVGPEILGDLVAVRHARYHDVKKSSAKFLPYERRLESCSGVKEGDESEVYFSGAFFGGLTGNVLELCRTITNCIRRDLARKPAVVAIRHDESYLNRYFIDHPPTKILSQFYCYPEDWPLGNWGKILALKKDHSEIGA